MIDHYGQAPLPAFPVYLLAEADFPPKSAGSENSTNATLLIPCSAYFHGSTLGTCIADRDRVISVG